MPSPHGFMNIDPSSRVPLAEQEPVAASVPHCPVCGDGIRGPSPVCLDCDTPAHSDCWSYLGRCAVYGCGSWESREPAGGEFLGDGDEEILFIDESTRPPPPPRQDYPGLLRDGLYRLFQRTDLHLLLRGLLDPPVSAPWAEHAQGGLAPLPPSSSAMRSWLRLLVAFYICAHVGTHILVGVAGPRRAEYRPPSRQLHASVVPAYAHATARAESGRSMDDVRDPSAVPGRLNPFPHSLLRPGRPSRTFTE